MSGNKEDVVQLHGHNSMSVEEVLSQVSREGFKEILIIGYDKNDTYQIRGSGMDNKDALWLFEWAKSKILDWAAGEE